MTEIIPDSLDTGRVHVVRHTFTPSAGLEALITDFVGSDEVRPPFILRSTKEVRVASYPYLHGEYHDADDVVQQAIVDAERQHFTVGEVKARPLYRNPVAAKAGLDPDVYRIAFVPVAREYPVFSRLLNTLDAYPKAPMQSRPIQTNYLTLDIPGTKAFDALEGHRLEKEEEFMTAIERGKARHLYTVTVLNRVGIEDPRVRSGFTREAPSVE